MSPRRAPRPASPGPIRRLLLASEGRPFTAAVLDRAMDLARPDAATIDVLVIARIWGTQWGFPNPWLMPSRREIEACRAHAAEAVAVLATHGFTATATISGARDAARRIAAHAASGAHDTIVMGADAASPPWIGDLFWSNEPHRVTRRAAIPVHLVVGCEGGDQYLFKLYF